MSAHTPGPWSVKQREAMEDGSIYPMHINGGAEDLQVCLMESPHVAHLIENDPAWKSCADSQRTAANAKLIAAAPKLLEALERLFAQSERLRLPGQPMSDAEKTACSVIAHVTGAKP